MLMFDDLVAASRAGTKGSEEAPSWLYRRGCIPVSLRQSTRIATAGTVLMITAATSPERTPEEVMKRCRIGRSMDATDEADSVAHRATNSKILLRSDVTPFYDVPSHFFIFNDHCANA
jgi:hypothetical protein